LIYAQRSNAAAAVELKYLIPEPDGSSGAGFCPELPGMDEFSVGRPYYSYPVHSLYVDSDDLTLYWRTINGTKNRFKLRLRYYSLNADSPVFYESLHNEAIDNGLSSASPPDLSTRCAHRFLPGIRPTLPHRMHDMMARTNSGTVG